MLLTIDRPTIAAPQGVDDEIRNLQLAVNGRRYAISAPSHATLLQVIRNNIGLPGTKENCLESECGVCTVLLDGKAVTSCIVLAAMCEGREITTIEGLEVDGEPDPLQLAFLRHGAVQCGYCIPGMILTARSYLDEIGPVMPSRDDVREALSGTLCRCTGYGRIVDAVMDVAADHVGSNPCS